MRSSIVCNLFWGLTVLYTVCCCCCYCCNVRFTASSCGLMVMVADLFINIFFFMIHTCMRLLRGLLLLLLLLLWLLISFTAE